MALHTEFVTVCGCGTIHPAIAHCNFCCVPVNGSFEAMFIGHFKFSQPLPIRSLPSISYAENASGNVQFRL